MLTIDKTFSEDDASERHFSPFKNSGLTMASYNFTVIYSSAENDMKKMWTIGGTMFQPSANILK